ncbi:MAG: hypothetical protein JWR83_1617 [Aeromicrobium sp.]|nr:hypothetical protein [Aeromicrobium sp.]
MSQFEPMTIPSSAEGRAVFLSASIPDPARWEGNFDAREITDAVVAACRAVLTVGGTLVTAAHPSIAPLLLYVAGEFPPQAGREPMVVTYQAALFENVMPEATLRFADSGVGEFRITPAVEGDEPTPGRWDRSLRLMRETMFAQAAPVAAIFVGGMDGIREEFELLKEMNPEAAFYPLAQPGGESARLEAEQESDAVRELLATSDVYPTIFREVMNDLARRLS